MRTDPIAGTTADAGTLIYAWLAFTVLLHLAGTGTAAHSDIFDRAAKACRFMTFEMRQ